jgi:hypothetical protein
MDEHLTKPIDAARLRQVIERFCPPTLDERATQSA